MSANGYNPMRHDCDSRGCFNKLRRPKIEMFCDCFDGKISFGDCDGKVEVNGNLLFMEWKEAPIAIPTGQRIMYERITVGKNIGVICVAGDAATMRVTHHAWFWDGKWKPWESSSFKRVWEAVKKWNAFAKAHNPRWEMHRLPEIAAA